MLSDVEKSSNVMLTRLSPVAALPLIGYLFLHCALLWASKI